MRTYAVFGHLDFQSMWTTLAPALVAAAAALGGVTVGAFLEPIKMRAAHRTRLQQERLDRCVQLVEATNEVRGLAVALSRLHGNVPYEPGVDVQVDWADVNQRFRTARAQVRTLAGVLRIYGPDDLADKAQAVRDAGAALAWTRFPQAAHEPVQERDDENLDRAGGPTRISPEMRRAVSELDQLLSEFTDLARVQSR